MSICEVSGSYNIEIFTLHKYRFKRVYLSHANTHNSGSILENYPEGIRIFNRRMQMWINVALFRVDPGIFNWGANTFKEKSGGTWIPTHSQIPCFCKNRGGAPLSLQK